LPWTSFQFPSTRSQFIAVSNTVLRQAEMLDLNSKRRTCTLVPLEIDQACLNRIPFVFLLPSGEKEGLLLRSKLTVI
jgi:hypothetical protein